jgi:hypothetical protein
MRGRYLPQKYSLRPRLKGSGFCKCGLDFVLTTHQCNDSSIPLEQCKRCGRTKLRKWSRGVEGLLRNGLWRPRSIEFEIDDAIPRC